jgi:tetratricopeptide (TPR) repeat protein
MEREAEAVARLEGDGGRAAGTDRRARDPGDILRRQERYAEAERAYDRALQRVPEITVSHWPLLYARGITRERTRRWPEAEADLIRALELEPDQPLVLNYLGYSWVDQGMNLSEAEAMLRRAVDLRPDDGYIVDSLGWAYYRLDRLDEAVRYLERAVELRPDDPVITTIWRRLLAGRPPRKRGSSGTGVTSIPRRTGGADRAQLERGLEAADAGRG